MTNEDFNKWANDLSGDQLTHLGASLMARAAGRRRCQITEAEAWRTYVAVEEEGQRLSSMCVEAGWVRKACLILVGWRGYHPEQVTAAMTIVAEFVIDWPPAVAKAAVEAGCMDGMGFREGLA